MAEVVSQGNAGARAAVGQFIYHLKTVVPFGDEHERDARATHAHASISTFDFRDCGR